MEVLLLIGLVALAAATYRLQARVRALEELVESGALARGDPPRRAEFPAWQSAPRPAAAPRAPDLSPAPEQVLADEGRGAPPPRSEAARKEMLGEAPRPATVRVAAAEENSDDERETLAGLFERFVGGRLLIWTGGIAFALAGIFLVRYSIEIGLITPPVRMLMAASFGLLLLAAGEVAHRRPSALPDPRIAQALAGAGILILYATPYGAHILYGLIGLTAAFGMMTAVTLVALLLALRHGAAAAVMGLAGGFATPLLLGEGSESSVPLLTYLALLNVGLFLLAGRRGWTWLAAAAVTLSFLWTIPLLGMSPAHALPAGVFILILAVAGSLVQPGQGSALRMLRPAGIGLLQLAVLVGRTDLGLPAWGLFGLLSAAGLVLSLRGGEYRALPPLALLLALLLLAAKAFTLDDPLVPEVAAAIVLLFAGYGTALALLRRDASLGAGIAATAFVAPAVILRLGRPELLAGVGWGALFAALALGPLLIAWSRRRDGTPAGDQPLFAAAAGALLLLGIAAAELLPYDLLAAAWLLLAVAAALASSRLKDSGVSLLSLLAATVATIWAVAMVPDLWATIADSLGGAPALLPGLPTAGEALKLLVIPAPLLVLVWHYGVADHPRLRQAIFAAAGLLLTAAVYVFAKQVFALQSRDDFVARGLAERTMLTQALFLAGWVLGTGRIRLPWVGETLAAWIGTILTAAAAARMVWFDMFLHNPLWTDQNVGAIPALNLIVPAFILPFLWLYAFRRRAGTHAASGAWLTIALAALIFGTALLVRQLFQGAILTAPVVTDSESYAYSVAGVLLSGVLLIAGVRLPDKALRLAGLLLLTATTLKVFLNDASALEGLLRILSLLGLGAALIGIGKLYGTVLHAEAGARRRRDEAKP
jgi:uncharacterized membrane protein